MYSKELSFNVIRVVYSEFYQTYLCIHKVEIISREMNENKPKMLKLGWTQLQKFNQ